jgi:hypothetical protein
MIRYRTDVEGKKVSLLYILPFVQKHDQVQNDVEGKKVSLLYIFPFVQKHDQVQNGCRR